jgi:hypothetical protein
MNQLIPAPEGAIKVVINVNSNHPAYGRLSVGQVLNVDEVTGGRWLSMGIASVAPDVPRSQTKAATLAELEADAADTKPKTKRGRKPRGS